MINSVLDQMLLHLNFLKSVFIAYMVVLKKSTNVGLAAFLVVVTVITKLTLVTLSLDPVDSLITSP